MKGEVPDFSRFHNSTVKIWYPPPPTYYSKTQPNDTFVVLFWMSFLYKIQPLEDAGVNKECTMTRQFKPECTATSVIATG